MIAAAVFVLLLTFFAPLPYYSHFLPSSSTGSLAASLKNEQPSASPDAGVAFPHHSLTTYLASLLSLLIATFLGFLDDLFDIRWRYKLPIPSMESVITQTCVTMLMSLRGSYCVNTAPGRIFRGARRHRRSHTAGTWPAYPAQHRAYERSPQARSGNPVASCRDCKLTPTAGPLYYIYMSMLSTFCTNSINILAGVNGVEVGSNAYRVPAVPQLTNQLWRTGRAVSGHRAQYSYKRSPLHSLQRQHPFAFLLGRFGQPRTVHHWLWAGPR